MENAVFTPTLRLSIRMLFIKQSNLLTIGNTHYFSSVTMGFKFFPHFPILHALVMNNTDNSARKKKKKKKKNRNSKDGNYMCSASTQGLWPLPRKWPRRTYTIDQGVGDKGQAIRSLFSY